MNWPQLKKCKYCDKQWIYQFWLLDRNKVWQAEALVCKDHYDIAKSNQDHEANIDYWNQTIEMTNKKLPFIH